MRHSILLLPPSRQADKPSTNNSAQGEYGKVLRVSAACRCHLLLTPPCSLMAVLTPRKVGQNVGRLQLRSNAPLHGPYLTHLNHRGRGQEVGWGEEGERGRGGVG